MSGNRRRPSRGPAGPAASRRGPGRRIRRRQTALAINITSILLSLLVLAGVGFAWAVGGTGGDYRGEGNGTVVLVEVDAGGSLSDLSARLVDDGVVASEGAFMGAAADHPRANQLQPGWYRLEEHMSAVAAVDALLKPENRAGTVDLPTGVRFEDTRVVASEDVRKGIFTLISEASCIAEDDCVGVEELRRAAAETDLDALGVPGWARGPVAARGDDPRRLEGLIIAGVHQFDPTAAPAEILGTLVRESVARYEDSGIGSADQAVGLSPYEVLTAASLVQMEARDEDFPKVARVILNRLAEPMRLQFDSTVNYDLPDQEIATTDEDRARPTPWNTYAADGLPATPIAAPSIEAIRAMEAPAAGDWLYFVTVDREGTTVFTTTLEEHTAAIQEAIDNGVLDSNR